MKNVYNKISCSLENKLNKFGEMCDKNAINFPLLNRIITSKQVTAVHPLISGTLRVHNFSAQRLYITIKHNYSTNYSV